MAVLESINFLIVSGNCIIVMGIDEKIVKTSISLTMKDFIEYKKGIDAKEETGTLLYKHYPVNEKSNSNDIASYYKEYLQKITNLEIPVRVNLDEDGINILTRKGMILADKKDTEKLETALKILDEMITQYPDCKKLHIRKYYILDLKDEDEFAKNYDDVYSKAESVFRKYKFEGQKNFGELIENYKQL
jgi:DNA-directed RNA polymerase subunit N (RpoN/RPB10)